MWIFLNVIQTHDTTRASTLVSHVCDVTFKRDPFAFVRDRCANSKWLHPYRVIILFMLTIKWHLGKGRQNNFGKRRQNNFGKGRQNNLGKAQTARQVALDRHPGGVIVKKLNHETPVVPTENPNAHSGQLADDAISDGLRTVNLFEKLTAAQE